MRSAELRVLSADGPERGSGTSEAISEIAPINCSNISGSSTLLGRCKVRSTYWPLFTPCRAGAASAARTLAMRQQRIDHHVADEVDALGWYPFPMQVLVG